MTTSSYDVISGAESFYIEGNEIGILLIHGFVGTPQSIQFLGLQFGQRGYTVLAPRLKGHGTNSKELEVTYYKDWITEIETGYQKLKETCQHVFVIGQSMGGALSLLLASKVNPSGVITINAAYEVPGYEQFINEPSHKYIREGKPDIKDETVVEITYPSIPVHAVHQLLAVIETSKKSLSTVTTPLLLFKSSEDHVVPPSCTDFVYDHVKSKMKEKIELTDSYHVASMDFDKYEIVNKSVSFIENMIEKQKKQIKVS